MENRHIPKRSYPERGRITSDGARGISRPDRPRVYLDMLRDEYAGDSSGTSSADDLPTLESPQRIPVTVRSTEQETKHEPIVEAVVNEQTLELDMRLPGVEQLLMKRPVTIFSRWRFMKTPMFKTVATSLGVMLVIGGWVLGQAYLNLQKSFQGTKTTAVALQKAVDPTLLKGEGDGRVNILLLGNGGYGHTAPDLTDTLIVASIDPVNGKVALVSVPRDTWVNLPGHGTMKINAAYPTGKYDFLGKIDSSNANSKAVEAGFASIDQAIEQVLGITIHYNALVNFISFKKAVDTLGGVTVDVPEDLRDPTMAWENGWNAVLARKGLQVFDGKRALLYARSRHTSSDFARSNRQRALITAIKDKAVTLGTLSNPIKITQLLNTFGNNVKTDMSITDATRAYALTKDIADSQIESIGLGDGNTLVTTGRAGNQSIVLPTAGLFNYDAIHDYIHSRLPDGYIVKEKPKVLVLNATTDSELGEKEAEKLATYGYTVVDNLEYGTTVAQTQVIDLTKGKKKYTKNYLQRRYSVKATRDLIGGVQPGAADFIIVLGNNEITR